MIQSEDSFFSIPFQHIPVGKPLKYDLYINSSIVEVREKFVRIFPTGGVLSRDEIAVFRAKYQQIYIRESQRDAYFKSMLLDGSIATPAEKVELLKNAAITHLGDLFQNKDPSNEALNKTIDGCKDVVENMVDVLNDHTIDTLKELIGNLSFHDFYTYDHSINVSMYCILIFKAMHPEATRVEIIQAGLAGLLHDVGKIKIPTYIINKPGKLNDEEFAQIRRHPEYGFEFLCRPGVKLPEEIDSTVMARAVLEHHENFDGSGYPNRLEGERIHLLARITAVADFFDAITTKRSYHRPLSTIDALALMKHSSGKKLDPKIFVLFAEHTVHFEMNRTCPHRLNPDFDPCQPHSVLPLVKHQEAIEGAGQKGFGKIRLVGKPEDLKQWANLDHVTLVDPGTKAPPKTSPRKKSS